MMEEFWSTTQDFLSQEAFTLDVRNITLISENVSTGFCTNGVCWLAFWKGFQKQMNYG